MTDPLPSDWSPVEYSSAPVPGDPAVIQSIVDAFHNFSSDVKAQNDRLKALHGDMGDAIWKGPAAEAFKPQLDKLPPKLDKVVASFAAAGEALAVYASKHRGYQQSTVETLKQATAELGTHAQAARSLAGLTQPTIQPAGTTQTPDQVTAAQKKISDAQDAVKASQGRLDSFHHECEKQATSNDHAAQDACHALDDALDKGIKNKHGFFHWVSSEISKHANFLKQLSGLLNTLSGILGVCALLTSWIPIVGEVFEAASLITGGIALVIDVALAATGNGSWSAVAVDAIGVAAGGAGHLFGDAAKASRAAKGSEELEHLGKGEKAAAGVAKKEAKTAAKAGNKTAKSAANKAKAAHLAKAKTYAKSAEDLGEYAPKKGASALRTAGKQSVKDAKRGFLPENLSPAQAARNVRQAVTHPGTALKEYTRGAGPGSYAYRAASVGVGTYGAGVTLKDSYGGIRKAHGDGDPSTVFSPRPYGDPYDGGEVSRAAQPWKKSHGED